MQVIEVLPLTKASQIESLSYYSSVHYPVGTIIDVPIRKQTKRAVVVNSKPVSATKTALKSATFNLKKLPEQEKTTAVPASLIATARRLQKTTPASLGAILFSILPPEVREGEVTLSTHQQDLSTYESPVVSVIQDTTPERWRNYQSRIRATFAHRGSLLLIAPTSVEVEQLREQLSVGIENRVVTLTTAMSKKRREAAYEELSDLSHAKLIITTPTYSCVDRHDITHVIIEKAHSSYYKTKSRPYLDIREVLIHLAAVTGREVLLGDLLLRSEEEYRRREDWYQTEEETPKRVTLPGQLKVIEQKTQKSASDQFSLLSEEVLDALTKTAKSKGHSFVLAARRGIAPLVTCVDCGHVFRCPDSGEPYSLYRTTVNGEERRYFVAPNSGRRLRAPDTCDQCGSWRLKERGIGIQHIESVIKKELPDLPLITFDHTTASTPRKAQRLISSFYETKGAILLGTNMTIPYLDKVVETIVVSSAEATRSMPTWRAEETYLSLLLQLREKCSDTLLLQTRTPEDEIANLATQGLVEKFYDDELALRRQLSYPPFATFIHLTLEGTAEVVTELERDIAQFLESYSPRFYPAPQPAEVQVRRYGLIRIPAENWPDEGLMRVLQDLPPAVRIEINPEKII